MDVSSRCPGALVVAILLLANALLARWNYATAALDIDYWTLWGVPHALATPALAASPAPDIYLAGPQHDLGDVLREDARAPGVASVQSRATAVASSLYDGRVDVTGTPFVYAVAGVFSSGDFAQDVQAYQWFSLVCLAAALILLARLLGYPAFATLLLVAFFCIGFTPIRADVRAANLNEVQLLALATYIALSSRGRRILAGLVLGVAIALKPNMLGVAAAGLVFTLAHRDYRGLARLGAGLLAALIVAVAVGALYFGRLTIWSDFFRSLPQTLAEGYPLANGNYGLASLIATWTTVPVASAITMLLCGLFVFVVVIRGPRDPQPFESASASREAFLAAGIGISVMLLGSRLAWLHYYALLIPALLYLLRPALGDEPVADRPRHVAWGFGVAALCCLTQVAQQLSTPAGEAVMANAAALLVFTGSLISIPPMKARSAAAAPRLRAKSRKAIAH